MTKRCILPLLALSFLLRADVAPAAPKEPLPPDQVLVKYREGATEGEKARARGNGQLRKRIRLLGVECLRPGAGETVDQAVERISRDPAVEYAEPDHRVVWCEVPRETTDDPQYSNQWYLDGAPTYGSVGTTLYPIDVDLDAPEAWALQARAFAETVRVVGVLDSGAGYAGGYSPAGGGYMTRRQDLPPSVIWSNPLDWANGLDDDGNGKVDDTNGWDFAENDNAPADTRINPLDEPPGHGTAVAGMVAAATRDGWGMASPVFPSVAVGSRVRLLPLRWWTGAISEIVEGISYAIERKQAGAPVAVLNGSFALPQGTVSSALRDAVWAAGQNGILFVAAGGNYDGPKGDFPQKDNDLLPLYPAGYSTTMPWVLAVGSVNRSGLISSFSHYGEESVQIAAPGEDVVTLGDEDWSYPSWDGTSFSAPLAAAAAALVMGQNPGMAPSTAIRRLTEGGVFDKAFLGRFGSARRLNLAGALSPFHPYSGLAYVGSTVPVEMYGDALSASFGTAVAGSSLQPAVAVFKGSAAGYAVSPLAPGLATFALSFPSSSAGVSTLKTGLWRVTALAPFWGRLGVGETVTIGIHPSYAGTLLSDSPQLAELLPAGATTYTLTCLRTTANAASVVHLHLRHEGVPVEVSGPFYVPVVVPSSGGGGGGGCFIATAAFGSGDAEEVRALRGFRDRVLLASAPGRTLVRAYYRISPPAADWLRRHALARAAVRAALRPVVFAVRHPLAALGLLLAGVGGGIWASRRRRFRAA